MELNVELTPIKFALLKSVFLKNEFDIITQFVKNKIVNGISVGKCLMHKDAMKHATSDHSTRRVIYIDDITKMDKEVGEILARNLATKEFLLKLIGGLGGNKNIMDIAKYVCIGMYRDVDGYFISPHPDTLGKIVTVGLFIHKTHPLCPGITMHDGDNVEQSYPYVENSGYAFIVSNKSIHSVKVVPENCVRVNIIIFYSKSNNNSQFQYRELK
jgi:hypothetical protein